MIAIINAIINLAKKEGLFFSFKIIVGLLWILWKIVLRTSYAICEVKIRYNMKPIKEVLNFIE